MNETVVTVRGRVVSEVKVKPTRTGSRIASFRLLTTERKLEDGRWVDGESSFFGVSCFGVLMDNVLSSIQRGHPVLVTGKLRVREFTQDDKLMRAVEINATSIGHDLTFGAAAFRRGRQATPSPEEESAAELLAEMLSEEEAALDRRALLTEEEGGDQAGLADVVEMSGSGAA